MEKHNQNAHAGENDSWQAAVVAAARRFVRAPELRDPSVFPAFGTAVEAEGAAALRSGNFNSYPAGVGFPGHASSTEWSFPQSHAALPVEYGEPSVFPAFGTVVEADGAVSAALPAFGTAAEAEGAALWTGDFNSYPAGVGFPGHASSTEWSFQQAHAGLPLQYEQPSVFSAFGTAAEAEGAVAAALRSGNFNSYPAGVGFPGHASSTEWSFPQSHAALPLEYGEPSVFPAFGTVVEAYGAVSAALPAFGTAAEAEGAVAAALWTDDFNSYPAGVGFPGHASSTEWSFQQANAGLPLQYEQPSVFSAFGTAAEAEGAAAAALQSGNFNSYPAGVGFPGHASSTEWSFPQSHTALPLEYGEPSVFPAFGTVVEADGAVSAALPAFGTAAEAEGDVAAALWTGDFNSYPSGVGFPGHASSTEWSFQQAHAGLPPQQGQPSVFPDSGIDAEVEGAVAATIWTGDFNSYPPGVGFPGHASSTEWSFQQAHAALPLEHGDSCSLLPGFCAVRDTALRHASVGLPNAHRHRSAPFFQEHGRVEAYEGENEELARLDTLLSPEQPLPLLQVLGDAEARAARPVVQVEQLGPNDLQHCLRQGESDRALDILALMVQEGKALNRAVDIEADERDISRAHPELVILLRAHAYISIRKQGDTLRAESYYRKHIRGVYPDGVSTGNPFADTLLAQLETTARTGGPPSDNHDFGDTNVTHRCVNDYLKVYFPEFRNEVEKGRTRLGLFGEKEGKWVRCLVCHKEYKGYNRSKLQYHQLRNARGKQALCQASTAYIRQQILDAEEDGSGRRARDGEAMALVPPPPDGASHFFLNFSD